ncbi:MAG: hypothetical protein H0W99_07460 [Acidobacteria bacterium]|nr:hypothetical protein [Acidobacteriota bacterium]
MAKKRKAAPPVKEGESTDPAQRVPSNSDRIALENVSSDMTRLLDEQTFETMEEVNDFVHQFAGSRLISASATWWSQSPCLVHQRVAVRSGDGAWL